MGGGAGIGSGAPVSPFNAYSPNGHGPLQTIESCKTHDVSISEAERRHFPPLGLQNVGNTCYANAALQCLLNTALSHALLDPASTHIFRRYSSNPDLLSVGSGSVDSDDDEDGYDEVERIRRQETRRRNREARRKTREKMLSQEKCQWLTGTLTDITRIYTAGSNQFSDKDAKSSWNSLFHLFSVSNNNRIVDPSGITRHVHKLSPCLRPYQQEDAHEFIRSLLSTLTLDGRNKQLSSLFDGLLESAVTCQTCHRASVTRDRYMDLSLDIQGSEVQDIVGALRKFTQTELLDNDNMVHCSRCDTKRVVSKGLRLATAPSILVCHLKRFAFDMYGRATRLSKKVKYPLRLEIGNYMSRANQGKPAPYELVGVIVHAGKSCERGHYLSYVKSGDDWYKANDEVVTKVHVDTVLNQQAYILLYEVEGMRANHGFYGCGRYHLTRSRSSKKRAEDLAAMHSDEPPELSLTYTNSLSDDNSKEKESNGGFVNLLDSMIDFCGSTSAAEAVRDAMCDTDKKPRRSKSQPSQQQRRHTKEPCLRKAGPVISTTSTESNFSYYSRVTVSDDDSSKYEHPRHHSALERIRSNSESNLLHPSKPEYKWETKRDVFRISDSSLETSRNEGRKVQREASGLSTDSQLIKSVSSNNLLEREEEAAHGYEKEFYPNGALPYIDPMTVSLHISSSNKFQRKENDRKSDPGIKAVVRRRGSSSAPRAGMHSSPQSIVKNDKKKDLPPLPVSKRR
jgi:hypothetical protein